jgi:uncharacterized protein (DUF433 family)
MQLPGFLVDHPDGEIRLTGHRIGLYDVVALYKDGLTPEELREQFPSLPLPLIQDVIDFYEQDRVEVDRYVENYRAELDRQRSSAPQVGPSLSELRRRTEAMSRERAR